MEPHNTLPPPGPDIPDSFKAPEQNAVPEKSQAVTGVETVSKQTELPQNSPPGDPHIVPVTQQAPAQTSTSIPTSQTATLSGLNDQDLAADDIDLIEKEWVNRAKGIIAQTSHDPHQQNKEINKIKADYIKKRYNKDIKISEA